MKFSPLIADDIIQLTDQGITSKMIEEIEDYAIIMMDPNGNVITWNNGAEAIKGYASHEIIGQNFRRFYLEKDLNENKPGRLLDEAKNNNRAIDEGWRKRKDGTRFWANVTITAIHDAQGQIVGYSKVTRDLTKNKETEVKLQKLRTAIDEIEDYAIILLDIEGNIMNWNKGAQNIKGYQASEIIGKNFRQFYTLKDLDEQKPDQLLKLAHDHGHATDEGWRIAKGGKMFWASVVITSIHDESGEVSGYSKVTRDLTEMKAANEQLEQYAKIMEAKNHELNQFAYIASHDLQEPLNTVKSVISILEDTYKDQLDETAADLFGYISDATGRMSSLIKGLLDYGRLGQQSEQEETDLNQILNEVVADMQSRIKSNNATVKIGKLPTIYAFQTEIRLLFQNLISNGIKFQKTDTAPLITINATRKKNEWVYSVSDNGIGIPEKYMDKLFMIFKRLPTEQEYEGTGIGLAHCKKVVNLHEGEIWVESTEGKGSTFYFTLPLNNTEKDEA